ncbi:TPM domain-containing protein [Allopusillimonas ginsengisoli]|uniref:TPM domain-containing protein n=1 Tax=Allopusillimonas ginsengisoli TaxID=453575 RepID=UPI003CC88B8B
MPFVRPSAQAPAPQAAKNAGRGVRIGLRLLFAGLLALAALLAVFQSARAEQVAVPELKRWVTDQTGTLDSNTLSHLEQQLAELDKTKGAQLAVLIVPTTGEDTIESYARRVFDKWRIGRAKVDDGILFVVAKEDRHLRIEVGYGLEGAVPDLLAGRIIREQVTPHFKQGDYAGGITAGVDSLVSLVNGEDLPPPLESTSSGSADEGPLAMVAPLAIIGFFMPPLFAALALGFFAFLMFGSVGAAVIAAGIGFIVGSVGRALGVKNRRLGSRAARRGGVIGGLGGGFGGGFGGGGGGGFGGGGGGFGGGGGGSSGGGGASGSW